MSYPSTIDSLVATNAQGNTLFTGNDHALDHRSLGSAVIAIETAMGTTAGTNIHKNFAAGDFPTRINASGILQQVVGGTVNLAAGTITGQIINSGTVAGGVYGTAQWTGGTVTAAALQGQMANTGTIGGGMLGTTAIQGGTATGMNVRGGTNVYHALGSQTYIGTVSTTQTLQCGSATRHLVNLANSAGSVTLAVAGAIESQPFIVEVVQGTAGLGTINWFSGITWNNGGTAVPSQGTTASRKSTYGFIATSTTTFDGYVVGRGE